MLSWARYIVFLDDPTPLVLARNEKISEIKQKREQDKRYDSEEDSDDMYDLQDAFKAHNIKAYSISNEMAAWQLIKEVAQMSAKGYP